MSFNYTSLFTDNEFIKNEILSSQLTVLSFGGGQDSMTILLKLIHDKEFRKKYAPSKLLVLFADTGNEHDFTYEYIDKVVIPLCIKHKVEFVKITNEMGFHSKGWQTLTHQWRNKRPTIGSMGYPKSCTHNLKLNPQYAYLGKKIALENNLNYGNKSEYKNYAKLFGKIRFLIGIAKNEEKRVNGFFYFDNGSINKGKIKIKNKEEYFSLSSSKKSMYKITYDGSTRFIDIDNKKFELKFKYEVQYSEKWKKASLLTEYPLLDIGYDRTACQEYINKMDMPLPFPSNCIFCPFSSGSHMEILWLYKNMPERFDEWCELEENKLNYFENNHNFIFNPLINPVGPQKKRIEIDCMNSDTLPFLEEQLKTAISTNTQITLNCINYLENSDIEDFVNKNCKILKVKVDNIGVTARKHTSGERKGKAFTLKDMLNEAMTKYPNVTLEELQRYKLSHGHCIESSY